MAKKSYKTQDPNISIFDVLEAVEWQESVAKWEVIPADQLVAGDILRVKHTSGTTEGIYCTKGFYSERHKDDSEYYFIAVNGHFRHFNPKITEWVKVGHDPNFQVPRKDNMAEVLTEMLKTASLADHGKLNVLHTFEQKYCYLSSEYHPIVIEAWEKALVSTTTMEDVLEHQSLWSSYGKLPKEADEYIESHIFPLKGDLRVEAMQKMRWIQFTTNHDKGTSYFIGALPKTTGYYEPLFRKLIAETEDIKHLKLLCRIWGKQGHCSVDVEPIGKFWVEEPDGSISYYVEQDGSFESTIEAEDGTEVESEDGFDDQYEEECYGEVA